MNTKILPLGMPVVDAYNNVANITSILTNYKKTIHWIQSQFIQLYFNINSNSLTFYIPYIKLFCPWITNQTISRGIIEKGWNGNIINFVINAIDSNCYVTIVVEQYYIYRSKPNSDNEYSAPHELFVFGYDKQKQIFEVADNIPDGKYTKFTCSFDQLELSYFNYKEEYSKYNDTNAMITLSSFNHEREALPFNISQSILYLEDYLLSRDSTLRDQTIYPHLLFNRAYGINIYEHLKHLIETLTFQENDIRPFHVLYNHKNSMHSRVVYLGENGFIEKNKEMEAEFMEIVKKTLVIRNIILKGKNSNYIYSIDKLLIMVEEIVNKEKQCISEVLSRLKKTALSNYK
jgi:hypothetical protein